MNSVKSIEPAIDPGNKMTFLLDWELTMKCNLDCTYCLTDLYKGGHDNSTSHPPLDECLKTIDFMYQYVDRVMESRIPGLRHVVLNVYGGESLHHPNIEEILAQVRKRYEPYSSKWSLTVTTTTNLIVTHRKLEKIIPYIDEFTASYHTEASDKQKEQFKSNVLTVKAAGKRLKCIVLMHAAAELFQDAQDQIAWCQSNDVRYLPRQLDHAESDTQFNYNKQQVVWFDKEYARRSHNVETTVPHSAFQDEKVDLALVGRSCCGGRQLCTNQNYKERHAFVNNRFVDWFCSVDKFFLYIKQVTGEVFVNKDCKMNYAGQVGPIGTLSNAQALIDAYDSTPVIQCKKWRCYCGLCAPKAQTIEEYHSVTKKYIKRKT